MAVAGRQAITDNKARRPPRQRRSRKRYEAKFSVIAGKRRLQALSQLVEEGSVSPRIEVPCRVVVHDADLAEISLAENVQREPMHAADEFQAFRRLVANGKCVADVAARFGVSEAVVNRRLSLARVNPTLLQKYREGEMNLKTGSSFCEELRIHFATLTIGALVFRS